MDVAGRKARKSCQLCDRLLREQTRHYAADVLTWQITDDRAQRMLWPHFVIPVRDYKHCARSADTTSKVLEEIQRRLISPLHILEDDSCRFTALEIIEHGAEYGASTGIGVDEVEKCPFGLACYVMQWR